MSARLKTTAVAADQQLGPAIARRRFVGTGKAQTQEYSGSEALSGSAAAAVQSGHGAAAAAVQCGLAAASGVFQTPSHCGAAARGETNVVDVIMSAAMDTS